MKALLLAGGKGTRLGVLSKETPKCMTLVNNKPVIDYLVDHLVRHRVLHIFVNLHHLPDKVYGHLGSRVFYTYEKELLGEQATTAIVTNISPQDDWVIMNADTLTNVNITEMHKFHKLNEASQTLFYKNNYGGTQIISPYQKSGRICQWNDPDAHYFDIGTPDKLQKAREYYEQ